VSTKRDKEKKEKYGVVAYVFSYSILKEGLCLSLCYHEGNEDEANDGGAHELTPNHAIAHIIDHPVQVEDHRCRQYEVRDQSDLGEKEEEEEKKKQKKKMMKNKKSKNKEMMKKKKKKEEEIRVYE
jgi:hypothetical protein